MVFKGFAFRSGYSSVVPAEVIGAELERLGHGKDGLVEAQEIVEAAMPDDAPLHDAFTWNDEEAAQKQRLHEARYLARSVVPVYQDRTTGEIRKPELYYVHVTSSDNRPSYAPMSSVVNVEEYRDQVKREAMNALEGWRRRWQSIEDFGPLFQEIDRLLEAARPKEQVYAARPKRRRRDRQPAHA